MPPENDAYEIGRDWPDTLDAARRELSDCLEASAEAQDEYAEIPEGDDVPRALADRIEGLADRADFLGNVISIYRASEAQQADPAMAAHYAGAAGLPPYGDGPGQLVRPPRLGGDPHQAAAADPGAWLRAAAGEPLTGPHRELVQQLTGTDQVRSSSGRVIVPWTALPATAAARRSVMATGLPEMPGQGPVRDTLAMSIFPVPTSMTLLGIMPNQVRYGERRYQWLRTPTAATGDEGSGIAVPDQHADTIDLLPKRAAAATTLSWEVGRVDPRAAMGILDNFRGAVSDVIEQQVLAPLFAPDGPADPGAANTFPESVAMFLADIDGVFANSVADIRAVLNGPGYAYLGGLFPAGGSRSALEVLTDMGARLGVSAHAPGPTATHTSKIAIRRGLKSEAYAFPLWPSLELELVADTSTGALRGRSLLIGAAFYNFQLAPHPEGNENATRGDFKVGKIRTA